MHFELGTLVPSSYEKENCVTDEKIRVILKLYEEDLLDLDVRPLMMPTGHRINPERDRWVVFSHCLAMIPEMKRMLDEGDKRKKVDRWLEWMQGALACFGVYTVEEERTHNRS
jgi:hypothetical protein